VVRFCALAHLAAIQFGKSNVPLVRIVRLVMVGFRPLAEFAAIQCREDHPFHGIAKGKRLADSIGKYRASQKTAEA